MSRTSIETVRFDGAEVGVAADLEPTELIAVDLVRAIGEA